MNIATGIFILIVLAGCLVMVLFAERNIERRRRENELLRRPRRVRQVRRW